jgi:hypothetical protein
MWTLFDQLQQYVAIKFQFKLTLCTIVPLQRFCAAFTQQAHSEIIANSYPWMTGKTSEFSVPVMRVEQASTKAPAITD